MSDAESAARAATQRLVSELKVSGHLMNLDAGLFCIVQTPARSSEPAAGLPGVRVSLPPGAASRPEAVTIKSFRDDGWLHSAGDAALVRIVGGPAQILVTVYQAPGTQDAAPNIQVLRLIDPAGGGAVAPPQQPIQAEGRTTAPEIMDLLAHIQERGDVGGHIGEWLGEPGSKRWIEGFAIAPLKDVGVNDIEYQAVLGRGWLSPWVEGGQFCGSRGMALPLLGVRIRLRGEAAEKFDCTYSASFLDGTTVGPVRDGEPCESETLAAIDAIRVTILPKGQAADAPDGDAVPGRGRTSAKEGARKPAARSEKAR